MKIFIVSVFLISTNAFAFPFLNAHKSTRATLDCTDFSGKWEGVCTVNTGTHSITNPDSMEIAASNCSTIQLDKQLYPLNGTKTSAYSFESNSGTEILTLNWNDKAKKEFLLLSDNSIWNNSSPNQNFISKSSGTGTLKLVNNSIVIEETGNNDGSSWSIRCEYAKK